MKQYALALALAGAIVGLMIAADGSDTGAASQTRDAAPTPARSYDEERAMRDRVVERAQQRASDRPRDRLALEAAAAAHVARAQLTGNYADYVAAESYVERALALAPPGAGPQLARAGLAYSLHRLTAAERALIAIDGWAVVMPNTAAAVSAMRARIAFHRGDFEEAERLAAANLAQAKTPETLADIAMVEAVTGRHDEADGRYEAALAALGAKQVPFYRAWLHLQRGILDLDRGRYEEALAHYEAGDRELSGWWLIREHMAETHLLLGRVAKAARLYAEVTRDDSHPELLHAFADLKRSRGRVKEADALMERSAKAHEARLALVASAAGGHALDFFIARAELARERREDGAQQWLERALELARMNRDLRPGPEAHTTLAAAELAVGNVGEARRAIDVALASPWRTTDLYATAFEVLVAANDERASAIRAQALEHNPRAFD